MLLPWGMLLLDCNIQTVAWTANAVYSDIAKTYREITKGDYISNLVLEKQKEEERQRKQAVKR